MLFNQFEAPHQAQQRTAHFCHRPVTAVDDSLARNYWKSKPAPAAFAAISSATVSAFSVCVQVGNLEPASTTLDLVEELLNRIARAVYTQAESECVFSIPSL